MYVWMDVDGVFDTANALIYLWIGSNQREKNGQKNNPIYKANNYQGCQDMKEVPKNEQMGRKKDSIKLVSMTNAQSAKRNSDTVL